MPEEALFKEGTGIGLAWEPVIRVRLLQITGSHLMEFIAGTRAAKSLWELPEILVCGSQSEDSAPQFRRNRWFTIRKETVKCPACLGSPGLQCQNCSEKGKIEINRLIFRKPSENNNGNTYSFTDDEKLTTELAKAMAEADSNTLGPRDLAERRETRSLIERIFQTPKLIIQKGDAQSDQFLIRFHDIYAPTEKFIQTLQKEKTFERHHLQRLLATYLLEKKQLPATSRNRIFRMAAIGEPDAKSKNIYGDWRSQLRLKPFTMHNNLSSQIAEALARVYDKPNNERGTLSDVIRLMDLHM